MNQDRLHAVDNAKGALMLLVVFGHLIETKIQSYPLSKDVYFAIYTFHMPLFVFLSGMLSRSELTAKSFRKSVTSLIIPLVVFQAIYTFFGSAVPLPAEPIDILFVPHWILWYLWSLFCWRMALPYLKTIRFSFVLSIMVSLLAGFHPDCGYFMGISRTLLFLPFFLAGHLYGKQLFQLLQSKRRYFQAVCLLTVIGFVIDASMSKGILTSDVRWLYGSFSYHKLNAVNWLAPVLRFGLEVLAVLGGISFLSLMPERESFLGKLGKYTMSIYLWHVILVPLFYVEQLIGLYHYSPLLGIAVDLLIAISISTCLSSQVVANLTMRMLNWVSEVMMLPLPSQENGSISDSTQAKKEGD